MTYKDTTAGDFSLKKLLDGLDKRAKYGTRFHKSFEDPSTTLTYNKIVNNCMVSRYVPWGFDVARSPHHAIYKSNIDLTHMNVQAGAKLINDYGQMINYEFRKVRGRLP